MAAPFCVLSARGSGDVDLIPTEVSLMRLTLLAAGGMLAITLATAAKARPEHVWAEGFFPNLATQTELANATPSHAATASDMAAARPPGEAHAC